MASSFRFYNWMSFKGEKNMSKMKDKLIKALENYCANSLLPATYRAMVSVYIEVQNGGLAPSEEEWSQMVLNELKEGGKEVVE